MLPGEMAFQTKGRKARRDDGDILVDNLSVLLFEVGIDENKLHAVDRILAMCWTADRTRWMFYEVVVVGYEAVWGW